TSGNLIVLGILGTIFFFSSAIFMKLHKAPFPIGTLIRTVFFLIFSAVLMGTVCWREWPLQTINSINSSPKDSTPIAIFLKCDMGHMPVSIPARSYTRVVSVNEKYMRSNKWGSDEISNDSDESVLWPNNKIMANAAKTHDPGVFIYKCEVSNHSKVN